MAKGITCPNHHVELVECGFPIPPKGQGVCPVSGASFAFEADVDETKLSQDKDGNIIKGSKWKISGEE